MSLVVKFVKVSVEIIIITLRTVFMIQKISHERKLIFSC